MGNTFWEFKDQLNAERLRRTVRYSRKTHYADVQVSPQWHQWLRHTRWEPPTLQEQAADVARQTQLKHNARLADERWAAKGKYIEGAKPAPNTIQHAQPAETDTGTNPGSDYQPDAWAPGPAKR